MRRGLPLILEATELEAQQLRLGDLRQHVGQPRLLQLEAADRVPEHHTVLGIAHRLVVARHRRTHGAPRDTVAGLRQAHERRLEAARFGQQRVLRETHVLQYQLARVAGAEGELAFLVLG